MYYRRSDNFITREIVGEMVLVPVGEQTQLLNGMITFSETGAFLWRHLADWQTQDRLAALMSAEYDLSNETAEADVSTFLTQAEARGLVVCCAAEMKEEL